MSLRDDNIPLADDDPQGKMQKKNSNKITNFVFCIFILYRTAIINDDCNDNYEHGKSQDSLPSLYQNDSSSSGTHSLESDINPDEQEEKARLISQVLELQNTLDGNCNILLDFPFFSSIVYYVALFYPQIVFQTIDFFFFNFHCRSITTS